MLCSAALFGCAACADSHADAPPAPIVSAAYALDSVPRELQRGERAPCYPDGLMSYRGERISYAKPVLIHPAFRPMLREFERIVIDVAEDVYGRPPARVLEAGAYRCREESKTRKWLSEHALGNALDVAGFHFDALPRDHDPPRGLPDSLRGSFDVRIDQHWNARSDVGEVHRDFLRGLAQRTIDRPDLFTTVLGPAYPGHADHLHLDRAPYRLIKVF